MGGQFLWLIRVGCYPSQRTHQGSGVFPFLLLIYVVVEEFQSVGQETEDPWGIGRLFRFRNSCPLKATVGSVDSVEDKIMHLNPQTPMVKLLLLTSAHVSLLRAGEEGAQVKREIRFWGHERKTE